MHGKIYFNNYLNYTELKLKQYSNMSYNNGTCMCYIKKIIKVIKTSFKLSKSEMYHSLCFQLYVSILLC